MSRYEGDRVLRYKVWVLECQGSRVSLYEGDKGVWEGLRARVPGFQGSMVSRDEGDRGAYVQVLGARVPWFQGANVRG